MTNDQLLRLEPLSLNDTMAVLWRWEKGKPRDLEDDAQVLCDIERLEHENRGKHRALADLAGLEHSHGLAGLPLALVQAGRFIRNATLYFKE